MSYSNIAKTSGSVPSTEGLPIYYDLYVPSGQSNKELPVIIFLHGFKGFNDLGSFLESCAIFANASLPNLPR